MVGVFRPNDPADGVWAPLPSALRLAEPEGDGEPFLTAGVTGAGGFEALADKGWDVSFAWRYRVDPQRLDARRLTETIDGLAAMDRTRPSGLTLTQGLDIPLRQFAASLRAARMLLAVIVAGMLATLAGLAVLAAGLAVRRRRAEFVLLRARGGAARTVLARGLAESLLVLPAAAVLGWYLGGRLPGAGPAGPLAALPAAVAATLVLPLAVLVAQRAGGGRRDLGSRSPAGRLTAELTLLLLAGVGAFLLRRRGLGTGDAVDPLLVSVPVLLAVAVAVLALRLYPWPLRLASRVAARARGSVAFLGTARAGRAGVGAPLVVVVLAVATAAFCGVVAAGIEGSRDRAATRAVPGDALVTGIRFAPDTAAELAALAGVGAVTPVLAEPRQPVLGDAAGRPTDIRNVHVLLVDGAGLADVARRAGVDVSVPPALAGGGTPPTAAGPGAPATAAGPGAPATAAGPGAPATAAGPGAPATAAGPGAPATAAGPGAPATAGPGAAGPGAPGTAGPAAPGGAAGSRCPRWSPRPSPPTSPPPTSVRRPGGRRSWTCRATGCRCGWRRRWRSSRWWTGVPSGSWCCPGRTSPAGRTRWRRPASCSPPTRPQRTRTGRPGWTRPRCTGSPRRDNAATSDRGR
ncbi:hypothetical protein [Micromonospora olivasterospora]|uniref:hypothetical protein n=1 Tax=Micromonospora olivasterospora TaxID=1880 RepID=UPI001FE7F7A1|nr:hypothetical protein [Micromonospora olivasterospora]